MTAADDLPPLREVIREHGLSARKSLGQNFILDLNLTRRIARAAGPLEGTTIIETGPGPGGLTRALLMEGARKVIAVERDRRCLPALRQVAERYPGRLELHEGDALAFDYGAHAPPAEEGPCRLVANLPYSVGTALLISWLKAEPWPPWYDRMVLMFQREVADRLIAEPNSKAYGRLAVVAQWRTIPRILFTLPPRAFTPAPKVASALVELTPRPQPRPPCSLRALETVTGAAFGQRRKMLRASLRQISSDPEQLLDSVGIEPTARAEQLTVSQFCELANALAASGGGRYSRDHDEL